MRIGVLPRKDALWFTETSLPVDVLVRGDSFKVSRKDMEVTIGVCRPRRPRVAPEHRSSWAVAVLLISKDSAALDQSLGFLLCAGQVSQRRQLIAINRPCQIGKPQETAKWARSVNSAHYLLSLVYHSACCPCRIHSPRTLTCSDTMRS